MSNIKVYSPLDLHIEVGGEKLTGLSDEDYFLWYDNPLTYLNVRCLSSAENNLTVGERYSIKVSHPNLDCTSEGNLKLVSKDHILGNMAGYTVLNFIKGE